MIYLYIFKSLHVSTFVDLLDCIVIYIMEWPIVVHCAFVCSTDMTLFYNLERTGKSCVRGKGFFFIFFKILYNNGLISILLQNILNLYYMKFSPYNIVAYKRSCFLLIILLKQGHVPWGKRG